MICSTCCLISRSRLRGAAASSRGFATPRCRDARPTSFSCSAVGSASAARPNCSRAAASCRSASSASTIAARDRREGHTARGNASIARLLVGAALLVEPRQPAGERGREHHRDRCRRAATCSRSALNVTLVFRSSGRVSASSVSHDADAVDDHEVVLRRGVGRDGLRARSGRSRARRGPSSARRGRGSSPCA